MSVSVEDQWKNFKLAHNKTYDGKDEEDKRLAIFQENLKKIEDHNERFEKGEETYKMGVNQFTDLTPEEMNKHRGLAPKK